jgi:hypothetical protein
MSHLQNAIGKLRKELNNMYMNRTAQIGSGTGPDGIGTLML